ncbi:MAG: heavy metal translocating P-type ATPase, partial [Robiginitomaculum sp.]|nr:heavy metal translocating P-type ATPase [Robiginitomaculum sp.]
MAELIFNVDDDEQGCPSGQSTPAELAARAKIEPPSGDIFTPYVQKNRSGDWAIDLMISGAHCAGCVAKIEREISALDNVKTTRMNLSTMRLNIAWAGEKSTANQLVTKLENLGFGAKPFHMQLGPLKETSELNALLKALGVAGAALAFIMTLSVPVWSGAEMSEQTRTFMHWVSAAIALPAVAYSGRPFFRSAWSALKNKQTNMDVPISLAVLLACALSIFETIHGNPDTYFDAA